MHYKITIDKYLNELAKKSPVPGGGSAAALTGAIGIGLLSMAARYTAKKSDSGKLRARLSEISKFTEYSRRRLKKLMAEDEKAYLRLSKTLRRCKAKKNITALYKSAANPPLEVCGILKEGLENCISLCAYCRRYLISDLAEAALLMEAGFLSAKLNVDINLAGIKNKRYTKKVRNLLRRQASAVSKAKSQILKKLKVSC